MRVTGLAGGLTKSLTCASGDSAGSSNCKKMVTKKKSEAMDQCMKKSDYGDRLNTVMANCGKTCVEAFYGINCDGVKYQNDGKVAAQARACSSSEAAVIATLV